MPSLYLTPASINHLNQFLLALVVTTCLEARFFAPKRQRPSSLDELLSRADQAPYAAKQSGRNCWTAWEEQNLNSEQR